MEREPVASKPRSRVTYRNQGDAGVGWKRSIGIVLVIALSISTSPLVWVSAAQPIAQVTIPPSGGPSEEMKPAPGEPKEKIVPADPGAPPRTRIQLAPFLTFGAKVELEYELEENFDLNDARADDESTLEPKLSLAFSYDPNKNFKAFLNFELSREIVDDERQRKKSRTKLELSQAFLSFEMMEGLSLRVGRQRFNDDRQWLYDENLDAVRAFYRVANLALELSVSRKDIVDRDLLNSDVKERINNYFLYGRYALTKKVGIAAYGLVRDDRSAAGESPIFFGLHSSGEIVNDLEYWLELAHVRGRDGSRKIRGIGLDLGFTYEFDHPWKPSITLGYAFGTGDGDPNDQVDTSFRQTGLQDNEDRFNGVTRFKYYGELFDPELSNLVIFTGGLGIRPTRRSSIDLVYHYYLQDEALNRIRESEIDRRPTGLSRKLGSEVDLIVGYREIRNLDVELVLGHFIPGSAFPTEADTAFFTRFEIRYSF